MTWHYGEGKFLIECHDCARGVPTSAVERFEDPGGPCGETVLYRCRSCVRDLRLVELLEKLLETMLREAEEM